MFKLIKNLFEWTSFQKEIKPVQKEVEISKTKPPETDSTIFVDENDPPESFYNTTSIYGTYIYDEELKKTKEWITKYRQYELIHDVDKGIDIIINEMVVPGVNEKIIDINLKDSTLSDSIKKIFNEKFNKILNLLNFEKDAYNIVRKWYVDGRIFYNIVVNKNNLKNGITDLIPIESIHIYLVRELNKTTHTKEYFYIYEDKKENLKWKIAPDIVAANTSGIFDRLEGIEVSNLHKAVKPINNLRNIEDSIVIKRLLNSMEKRVFTVATGMMNKTKSETYIKGLINRFRNRLKYNTITGEVQNEKHTQTLVEDYWFSENSEGKGTKVDVLEGSKNLSELDDLYYFKNNLWDAMNIPQSRRPNAETRQIYNTGREIERDEIEFHKFIIRQQNKFSELFTAILKRELVWTNKMSLKEFEKIENQIKYDWNTDNLYAEIKESELLSMRIENLNMVNEFVGTYFTKDEIAIDILKFKENEWKKKQKQLEMDKEESEMERDNFKEEPVESKEQVKKEEEKEPPEEEPPGEK